MSGYPRIVGYTYQADTYCPDCMVDMFGIFGPDTTVEQTLDRIACTRGIDREDERTFDSGDFPKVILSTMLDTCPDCGPDRCGACHAEL